jgi:hypothetical protein
VTVALVPATLQVDPGAEFDLEIDVTQAGDAFNGFDAYIGFDPAALTLVPLVPKSLQQGSLITSACGSTFHVFSVGTGSASISVALLCSDTFLTGPGQLYRLHFRAGSTPQTTAVTFLPGLQFYNAGLFVDPAVSSDAQVQIGGGATGVEPLPGVARLAVSVRPNPVTTGADFAIVGGGDAPCRVRIRDVRGAVLRSFDDAPGEGSARALHWDGRDATGRRAPVGMYVVTVERAGRTASRRIVLVR